MTLDIAHLRTWIGKQETLEDLVMPLPMVALSATLDRADPPPRAGDPLPPLWHWLYFLEFTRASELGEDGHTARGGFLPPVPLPRRMWAGSRFTFERPLRVGERVRRTSAVADVSVKDGRSGPLVFARVNHTIVGEGGPAIHEEHDIVYRNLPAPDEEPSPPRRAPADPMWRREVVPGAALLFRYSALSFNAHRIHFDRTYAVEHDGYPGLVVHGPLLATLLLDLLRRNVSHDVKSFRFRAVRPIFDTAPFAVCGAPGAGGTVALWAQDADGYLCMDAEAAA